jgi:hypothetical protein
LKNDREYLEAVLSAYYDSLKPGAKEDAVKDIDLEKDSPTPPAETRLPKKYCRKSVNDLLMKRYVFYTDVIEAFDWSDTPQGRDYWKGIYEQAVADRKMWLPHYAREYLLAMQKLDDDQESKSMETQLHQRQRNAELESKTASNTIDIKSPDNRIVGTCTITDSKTICLADHLKIQGQKYLIDLLADVKYVYGDAVLKLCGNNLRLDVDEVTTNLRKAMLRLRERLLEEIQSWFGGNGRLLETGPEIVECYISCRNGVWWLEEREAKSGKLGVAEEICSRLAHHLILASDVCNLLQEQKVMCLMNLILRR